MSGVERVPADHLVHFVIDAIGELEVRMARVNEQGRGSEPFNLRRLPTLGAMLKTA